MADPYAAREAPKHLAELKTRFEAGDKGALIDAIAVAAFAGVPLPEWAADAFIRARNQVIVDKLHDSWNAVFGEPHPGKQLASKRRYDRWGWKVLNRVEELHRQGHPIDGDMWELVAAEMRISPSIVRDYYYFAINDYVLAPDKPFPRGYRQPTTSKKT